MATASAVASGSWWQVGLLWVMVRAQCYCCAQRDMQPVEARALSRLPCQWLFNAAQDRVAISEEKTATDGLGQSSPVSQPTGSSAPASAAFRSFLARMLKIRPLAWLITATDTPPLA